MVGRAHEQGKWDGVIGVRGAKFFGKIGKAIPEATTLVDNSFRYELALPPLIVAGRPS